MADEVKIKVSFTEEQMNARLSIYPIVHRHWQDGGTGITNFSSKYMPIYEAALMEYGDECLCIVTVPLSTVYGQLPDTYALHDRAGHRDLSPFWNIYDRIREEMNL